MVSSVINTVTKKGKIEWEEFLSAVTSWLSEDFKVKSSLGKRKGHPDQVLPIFFTKISQGTPRGSQEN